MVNIANTHNSWYCYNMKINYKLIGKHIREIRKSKGITQLRLSEEIGISPQFMSRIESGIKRPSLDTLINIASVLETTVDGLLLGNQSEDRITYQKETHELLRGCNTYEQAFIFSVIKELKRGLNRLEKSRRHSGDE